MNDNDKALIEKAIERAKTLQNTRRAIMALPPEKALDAILDAPQPAALVHSFPQEDFFFLIHDIGLEDALPLLSLASNQQWEYILDIETWNKDRLDIQSGTLWLGRLLKADPDRLVRWCFEEKHRFTELYLLRNIELRIREYDQDGTLFGDDFFTDDDTFYIRFLDHPVDNDEGKIYAAQRNDFLTEFLRRLSIYDHVAYQQLLLESTSLLPAESEEDMFRLRSVRLAERGFLPFDEAVGAYQPIKISEMKPRSQKAQSDKDIKTWVPVPMFTTGMLDDENSFTRALSRIDDQDILFALQSEFASLANQIISADREPVRDRQALKHIIKKVSGYLSIGLEKLTEDTPESTDTATFLKEFILPNIFQVGYGCALALKWKAEKWRKRSWFENTGLPLSFWGESWLGVLGGLLIKKPKFFSNHRNAELYSEFNTLEEIMATDSVLDEIIALDDLLSALKIQLKSFQGYRFLTYKNLLLTRWADDLLNIPTCDGEPTAITLKQLKTLFARLWVDEVTPRKIDDAIKTDFLVWLSKDTGIGREKISAHLGKTLEALFEEIATELGNVDVEHLDPRFIRMFLIGREEESD